MYPMESLAIIAPIIFIVLMIAFPVIGIFAGWKRAVYWGAGNFIFYILGFVIWLLAGKAIGEAIGPKLQNAIEALKDADLSKIAQSVVAPIFFIIWMAFAEIVLIINYYAWFKKVAKLRKVDKEGKEAPTMKFKLVNGAIGAVALPALLLPTTFAFTQALFYTTTSTATRNAKSISKNLYNGLDKVNDAFSWFSYYKDTPNDFDALWAGLSLNDTKVTITLFGEVMEDASLTDALSQTFSKGFENIYDAATNKDSEDPIQDALNTIDVMGEAWNEIVKQAGDVVAPLFASDNATELVESMFNIEAGSTKITGGPDGNFDELLGPTGTFQQVIDAYADHDNKLATLEVSQTGIENISNVVAKYYVAENLNEDQQKVYDQRLQELVELLFVVK